MAKFVCSMCGQELDLSGYRVIKPVQMPYHEREEIVNAAFINVRLCGPMERTAYTDKDKGNA